MKTVVITGASAGIGKALAEAFAAKGYSLGLTARRLDKLKELQSCLLEMHKDKSINIEVAMLDVDQPETVSPSLQSLFRKLGTIDIVVVNAGINELTSVGHGQLALEQRIIATNVIGAIATVNAAAEHFGKCDRGHIVGISSLASLMGIPRQAAYCASKAAFSLYLESARIELKEKNIHVTTILPGFVDTDIMPGVGKYPFAISADQAADEMVALIERNKKLGVVPAYPWKYLKPFMRFIPDSYWKRMAS